MPNHDATAPGLLDALAVDARHHELLLENEKVRVLDTRIAPGERTPLHEHRWPAALHVIAWSDFVRRDRDGAVLLDSRTLLSKPAAGSVLWGAPLPPHSVENVGDTELRVLAIEIKG